MNNNITNLCAELKSVDKMSKIISLNTQHTLTKTIKVNSSRCGAGKTTSMIKLTKQFHSLGLSVLIVQPSIHLLEETHAQLPGSIMIHSSCSDNVSKDIHEYTSHTNNIILITHQAFIRNDFDLPNTVLMLDEALTPYKMFGINLSHTAHKLQLSDYITTVDTDNDLYKVLEFHDDIDANALIDSDDDVLNLFTDLFVAMRDKHHNVIVTADMSDKFIDTDGQLIAHIVLLNTKFEAFNRVHMYGANIDKSLLMRVCELNVIIDTPFIKHDGKHVHIHTTDNADRGWSMYANNNHKDIKETFLSYVNDTIKANNSSSDGKHLCLDNIRQQMYANDNHIDLSHCSHGINEYRDHTEVVLMSAINPHPSTAKFLNELYDISEYDCKYFFMVEMYYQTALRTALRNNNNTKDVHIYCLDSIVAMTLDMDFFDNANMYSIEGTAFPEYVVPLTQAQRVKASHIRKNFPIAADISTRDLIKATIWSAVSSRGKLKAEIKDFIDPARINELFVID